MHSDCQSTQARQTQSQHSGSVSQSAGVNLLDILREVSTLPEMLTPDSQKALSATCKSCRLQFIAQVQVVTACEADYALILERRWPRLSMVISQDGDLNYIEACPSNIRICVLDVEADGNKQAIISMLRPLHNLAPELPCTQLAAQQVAHQMRIRWPQMNTFTMAHVLDGLGLEIVSQLVKGTWTHLMDLTLSKCHLKAEAFLLLSQGNWPGLAYLDVSGNCLDAEGMGLLAKGNWLNLASITLSFSPMLGAVAIAHLSAANWPIKVLMIEDTPFSVDMVAELADLQLPKLMSLYLTQADLTAAAVSKLARADWPHLTHLTLDHVDLDALGVLLGLDLDRMQELKSDPRNWLQMCERRTVPGPDVGLWPNLDMVRISKRPVHLTCE